MKLKTEKHNAYNFTIKSSAHGCCPRVSGRDVSLTTHIHLMQRLKIRGAILHRLICLHVVTLSNFTVTYVTTVWSSVTFKSQPTLPFIYVLP